MPDTFPLDELKIEPLQSHPITDFTCEIDDLTEFLCENSAKQMQVRINVTYIANYLDEVVGYFTLSADSIRLKDIDDIGIQLLQDKGIRYPSLPALKLCRLAVKKEYTGNYIGPYMVEKIIRQAQDLSGKIGLRFITVDAYLKAVDFYINKFQFVLFPKEKHHIKMEEYAKNPENFDITDTVPLYLDIYEK